MRRNFSGERGTPSSWGPQQAQQMDRDGEERMDALRILKVRDFWKANPNSAYEQSCSCTFEHPAIADLTVTRYWRDDMKSDGREVKPGYFISIKSSQEGDYSNDELRGPFSDELEAEKWAFKRMIEIKEERSRSAN